ncbi:MAG TPA: ABC transporter ATP-binding protein [Negativicutes bacterium]|nr:ABC transporter ATP-binding protein [Negativicutes bacterium]
MGAAIQKKGSDDISGSISTLNPKDMIIDIVGEPLAVNGRGFSKAELREKVIEALEFAGLKPAESYLYRYPYELSGGQRQRVAIASVFIMSPDFIIADEPVSMLDASVRADILNIMVRMRAEKNTSYLFITHDLSLAWLISDRVAIMYLGRIMEIGSYGIIAGSCAHPYSQALISALPTMEAEKADENLILGGETPSPVNLPPG